MRREGFLAMNEVDAVTCHCVSRVVDRSYKLGNKEKAVFVKMMRQYEDFCGVEVLSYCIMSNHFHLLVRVAKKEEGEIADEEFCRRLNVLYKPAEAKMVTDTLAKYRKNDANKMARELKARYTYRMGNVSEFMKSLKQKFSRWYNKVNARTGTMWEKRYDVTLVGPGWGTKVIAAYIDLNPLRAGMVQDPAEYRYSSYGEAVAKGGGSLASKRLFQVMNGVSNGASLSTGSNTGMTLPSSGDSVALSVSDGEKEALQGYRILLAEEGVEESSDGSGGSDGAGMQIGQSKSRKKKRSRGFSKDEVRKIIEKKGQLSLAQLLRCKTRYFTAGFAIGSKGYVDGVLERLKKPGGEFAKRKTGSSRIKHGEEAELCTLRRIQKDPL